MPSNNGKTKSSDLPHCQRIEKNQKSTSSIMEKLYSQNYQASKNINLLPKCISDLSYNLASFGSGNLPEKIIDLKLHIYVQYTHIYTHHSTYICPHFPSFLRLLNSFFVFTEGGLHKRENVFQ